MTDSNRTDSRPWSPGHDTPGRGYVYVRGMGTERSMLKDYLEAQTAMMEADCG